MKLINKINSQNARGPVGPATLHAETLDDSLAPEPPAAPASAPTASGLLLDCSVRSAETGDFSTYDSRCEFVSRRTED